jgi:hypothetical protein
VPANFWLRKLGQAECIVLASRFVAKKLMQELVAYARGILAKGQVDAAASFGAMLEEEGFGKIKIGSANRSEARHFISP